MSEISEKPPEYIQAIQQALLKEFPAMTRLTADYDMFRYCWEFNAIAPNNQRASFILPDEWVASAPMSIITQGAIGKFHADFHQ